MSTDAHYTPYHPKWYRRRVSVWWWLKNRTYAGFVLRELSSVFVAFFAIVLLWEIRAVLEGPEAYAQFTARLQTPLFLALDLVAFLFVLFHAITWFNAMAMLVRAFLNAGVLAGAVVRVRGKRLPDWVVAGSIYVGWLLLSVVVAGILLRG